MLKASWEALLSFPRGVINVIKGFPIMILAATLISPANPLEMFPEAPRPLVSVSSKEFHPLTSVPFITKKRGRRRWGPGLCARAREVKGTAVTEEQTALEGPAFVLSGARPPFLSLYSLLLNSRSCSPKEDPFVTRFPDSEGSRGAAGPILTVRELGPEHRP